MASEGPPERDVKDFRFQQLCRVRVFDRPDPSDSPPDKVTQLLACSSVFGFTFIGTKTGFHVIRTSDLTEVDNEHSTDRTTVVVTNFPFWVKFNLNGTVSHLALSCDDLTLAVVVTVNGVVQAYMYDVHGFSNKGSVFEPFLKVRMSSGVLDIAWNPVLPAMIVACLEDGSISLLKITDKLEIVASRPSTDAARCVCWSPKGKQLVVGTGKGTLVQFDQELKEKRNWACPDLFPPDQQVEVKGLVWVSTYMFLVSYLEGGSDQPTVVLVTGSVATSEKGEDGTFDPWLCMMGRCRYQKETILCTSRTACETSVIGKHFDNKNVFEHWILDDAARAELPLTEDYQDTFPLGVAVDLSSQFSIPVGENFHPPSPIFLLLSTDGVLVPYYMMYSHSEAGTITRPSQALPSGPIRSPKATGTVQRDAHVFGTSVANSGKSGLSILGQPVASPQISANQESTTRPSIVSTTTTQSVFGAGSPSQPFSFTSTSSNTSLGQGSQSQPSSFTSTSSNTSLGQGSQSQPFSFTSTSSNTSLGQGSQSQPFSFTSTSSNTSLGQGSQSQPFSFTPTTTKSTLGSLSTSSTAGFQIGTPSSAATATTNSASSADSPAVRSLFGTPGGITSSLVSSASTTGATSTQIGQSFLASALSSTTAKSEATTKTGFAASTQASSIFSLKQPAQGSSNFNFSAAVTKPTSGPTDVAKTNNLSISTTKPEDSKSGFNFSLNTPKSEMTDSKLSQPSLGNVGGASVFGGSTISAGAAKLPSSSTVASSDTGLFGGAGVTSKSTAPFDGLSTSSTSKLSTGSTTPSTGSGFTAFTGTLPQQQPPNSTATALKAGTVGTSSALSTGFGLGGTTASTAKGFGSTGGLPTFGNLQPSTSQEPGKSASIPPQKPTIPAAGGDNSLRTQPSPATEDTLQDTFSASIAEEMADFERELQEFKQRAGKMKEEVGIEEEMKMLRNNAIEMSKFCDEVKTNTQEQSKEISDLSSLCLDAFAMVEDCRMREQKNTDPQYNYLLRNKALDPASLETQRNLQQQQQLLDQGLRDVDAILDQEWQEYQSRKKNRNKIQRPTTDGIYQVMKSNRNLIIGQRNQLDELESQLKQLRMYNRRSEWKQPNNSGDTAELSLLADTLLEGTSRSPEKLNRTSRNDASISQKHANLREYLSHRSVSKVKSTRPENLSMSKLASTEKLREVLSRQERSSSQGRAVTENKPSPRISGRPILRATSHNGANKAALNRQVRPEMATPKSWQIAPEQVKSGFQQPSSFQLQPNMNFVAGAGRGSVMATKMMPELLTDQYENISSTDATEDDEDDEYDDDDDDDGEGFGPNYNMDNEESADSEIDSRPVNRKIPERKPAVSITPSAAVSGFGSIPVGNSQALTMSGFGSKALGTSQVPSMPGFENKPLGTSQASAGSGGFNFAAASKLSFGSSTDKPSFTEAKSSAASALSSFKFDNKLAGNTSTPKTAFKFGSESEVPATGFAFSGKNLFGQPLKSQTVTTTTVTVTSSGESLSKGNSLLAKALSEDSDEEPGGTDDKTLTGNEPEISRPTMYVSVTTSNSPAGHGLLGKYLSLPPGSLTAAVNNTKETKSSDGQFSQSPASASGLFGKSTTPSQDANTSKSFPFGSSSNVGGGGLFEKSTAETTTRAESNVFGETNSGQTKTGLFGQMVSQISSTSSDVVEKTAPTQSSENAASQQIPKSQTEKSTDTGLFGTTSGALGTSSVSSTSGQASTSSTGLFGQASASAGTGLFGNSVKTSSTDTTGSKGQTKTNEDDAGLFGKTTNTETSNSGSGLSGQTTSTNASTSATGIFGQTTSPSTVGTGLFGQTNSASTSSGGTGLSGQMTSTISSSSGGTGLFGQTTGTTNTGGTGLFKQTPASSSGSGLFGQGVTSTASSTGSGLFGKSSAPTTTTGTGMFGQPSTTTSASAGLFGQSGSGLFGQTTTASSSGGGLFGQTTTTSSSGGGGLFGQTTTDSSSGGGLFGQTTTSSSSGGGLFGQTTTTSSSGGGLFGQTTTSSSSGGGLFGQSSTGGFGQTSSPSRNLFGGSTFGTQGTSSSSPFGQPSTLFGSAGTSSATTGFGSGPGFGQQSSGFGQTTSSSASPFGAFGSSSTSTGGFGGSGGLFSGLGGKPSEEKANTNVFGSVPAFGNPGNTSGGLFGGGQTSNPFGGGSPSSFTGGSFSGGSNNVASAGFGVAKQQSPGFGGAATFGGSPAFGGTSGFGSPPTFGGGSAFGSGASFSNPMGSPQSSGTSGGFSGFANNSNSPTFGALAQNSSGTPSFGNIAQESSPAFGGGFSGGGGFGASPGFGNQTSMSGNPAFTGYRS